MAVVMSREIQIPSMGTPASDLEVGSSVFLNVGGVLKEFLIVHQGLPDTSMYDASCDGVWLLMKNLYEKMYWDISSISLYASSSTHTYLNSTFLGLFDADIQAIIKTAKIPYYNNTGTESTHTPSTGASGLSARVFLPSYGEITGFSYGNLGVDGAIWDYFSASTDTSRRIAYYDSGVAGIYWMRTPWHINTGAAHTISEKGSGSSANCSESLGIRPALILPSNALFNPSTGEFVGVA